MFYENDMSVNETDDVIISAGPVLVDETAQQFLWGYYLCIENNSDHKITVIGKNWNITDDLGNRFCDDSAGFKGEIPELEPGECFEFTSTVPISSPNAVFYGSCKIVANGKDKDVKVPTFLLSASSERAAARLN